MFYDFYPWWVPSSWQQGGRAGGSRAVLSSGGWAAGPRQLVVGRAQSCGKQLGRREGGQTHRMNQNWMFIT